LFVSSIALFETLSPPFLSNEEARKKNLIIPFCLFLFLDCQGERKNIDENKIWDESQHTIFLEFFIFFFLFFFILIFLNLIFHNNNNKRWSHESQKRKILSYMFFVCYYTFPIILIRRFHSNFSVGQHIFTTTRKIKMSNITLTKTVVVCPASVG
jgi:hypothetical protein